MSSSYICQPCLRRLSQIRPRIVPRSQQRATFISLSRTKPSRTTDDKGKDEILGLGDDVGTRKGRLASLPERKPSIPRNNNTGPADILESLFEQSITEATISQNTSPKSIVSLEPYKKIEVLKDMMRQDYPPADSFHYFVENFGPESDQHTHSGPILTKPSYLISTARNLLRSLIVAKAKDPYSTTLPSTTEISSVYLRLGYLVGTDWADLVQSLIRNILKPWQSTVDRSSSVLVLLSDLLGAWNVVCRSDRDKRDLPEDSRSSLDWSHAPDFSNRDAQYVFRKSGDVAAFGMLTPIFAMRTLNRIPPLALATLHLVATNTTTLKDVSGDPTRFLSIMSRIISIPGLDISHDTLLGRESVLSDYIKQHSTAIKDMASANNMPDATRDKPISHKPLGSSTSGHFINRRLQIALRTQDRSQVDHLWADVVQWPAMIQDGAGSWRPGALSEHLCNHFIMVYMALRMPDRAIDVWNHMIKNHLTPSLATWESMLSGCKSSRDGAALEDVWKKMEAAQVQPDLYCWTTRISGLMHCYAIDAAMQALDEMGRKWLEAAKKQYRRLPEAELKLKTDVTGAVKPSIEVINAAIVGAMKRKRQDYAQQILAWAGTYGISPDVRTYNAFIGPLLRTGESQQATALLKSMAESGIEADVATYTTILDEIFRFAGDLSLETQKETVFGIFDEMDKIGLTATQHTYGKIIYSLLQASPGDMTGVNLVLERMQSLGLEPSTTIYTSLVQHYFTRDPPMVDAARSLINRASMVVGSTDNIFWDRAIEGFSRVGETVTAIRLLSNFSRTGSVIGWKAMRALLEAMARNEEWDLARTFVQDTIDRTGGPISPDERGKEGQHTFWQVVHDLDLLPSQKIEMPS